MREIVFDTETTGLDNKADRVIEIGGVELVDRFPTGRTYHVYINPEGREVHPEALAVHGISNDDLADKPVFSAIVEEFLEFFGGARLIAHNASFDMGFINAELARLGHPSIDPGLVIDTLAIARRKHPMGPNSLDALCRRYGIDNSHRTKHGALLDSELLAEVYIELAGGKQAALRLVETTGSDDDDGGLTEHVALPERPDSLPPRLSSQEIEAHQALIAKLGEKSIWARLGFGGADS
ncbi:DNA polymerase III subunit epsilon [Zhengella mangrovi]|uniref:DNA polymerase III subunit epsilon n=1 Tax=Zhengella mangrovi TaxID=1982044 RepID=A0A2G1QT12_9HYPH|nr:DNA polymerase III subunit epsilon [Zhengella mangrovi]PHP68619.1 DNA polymerase III subunit epsilon [Zhengella mangrovi]